MATGKWAVSHGRSILLFRCSFIHYLYFSFSGVSNDLLIFPLLINVFQALKSVVLYVILSPYDNEQSDLVHRISEDKKLEEIPKYK